MAEYSIQVDQLTRKFGSFTAVDAVSFTVEAGEIFGFLGANGAGKTTCIRMLTGLLRPSLGQALVAGFDVGKKQDAVKRRIGYMSRRFSLYEGLTAVENIRLFGGVCSLRGKTLLLRMHELLDQLHLKPFARQLVRDLPLGWRQKLAFSVSMLHNPAIVFLDEPTGGVDPGTRRQFWELIYQAAHQGTTVFVTTHHMEEAEYCHRAAIMASGKIEALDTPERLKAKYQASTLDEVFVHLNTIHRKSLGL